MILKEDDGKVKTLSDTYEHRMQPWEFWILLNN